MRLVDSISIVIAQLLYDPFNPIIVFTCSKISNDAFKALRNVSSLLRELATMLTPRLQPFSYRRACRSKHAGCFDPCRRSATYEEHGLSGTGFPRCRNFKSRSKCYKSAHVITAMARYKERARQVSLQSLWRNLSLWVSSIAKID